MLNVRSRARLEGSPFRTKLTWRRQLQADEDGGALLLITTTGTERSQANEFSQVTEKSVCNIWKIQFNHVGLL